MELAVCWDVWVAGEGTMKSHLSEELERLALTELELEEIPPTESVRQCNVIL